MKDERTRDSVRKRESSLRKIRASISRFFRDLSEKRFDTKDLPTTDHFDLEFRVFPKEKHRESAVLSGIQYLNYFWAHYHEFTFTLPMFAEDSKGLLFPRYTDNDIYPMTDPCDDAATTFIRRFGRYLYQNLRICTQNERADLIKHFETLVKWQTREGSAWGFYLSCLNLALLIDMDLGDNTQYCTMLYSSVIGYLNTSKHVGWWLKRGIRVANILRRLYTIPSFSIEEGSLLWMKMDQVVKKLTNTSLPKVNVFGYYLVYAMAHTQASINDSIVYNILQKSMFATENLSSGNAKILLPIKYKCLKRCLIAILDTTSRFSESEKNFLITKAVKRFSRLEQKFRIYSTMELANMLIVLYTFLRHGKKYIPYTDYAKLPEVLASKPFFARIRRTKLMSLYLRVLGVFDTQNNSQLIDIVRTSISKEYVHQSYGFYTYAKMVAKTRNVKDLSRYMEFFAEHRKSHTVFCLYPLTLLSAFGRRLSQQLLEKGIMRIVLGLLEKSGSPATLEPMQVHVILVEVLNSLNENCEEISFVIQRLVHSKIVSVLPLAVQKAKTYQEERNNINNLGLRTDMIQSLGVVLEEQVINAEIAKNFLVLCSHFGDFGPFLSMTVRDISDILIDAVQELADPMIVRLAIKSIGNLTRQNETRGDVGPMGKKLEIYLLTLGISSGWIDINTRMRILRGFADEYKIQNSPHDISDVLTIALRREMFATQPTVFIIYKILHKFGRPIGVSIARDQLFLIMNSIPQYSGNENKLYYLVRCLENFCARFNTMGYNGQIISVCLGIYNEVKSVYSTVSSVIVVSILNILSEISKRLGVRNQNSLKKIFGMLENEISVVFRELDMFDANNKTRRLKSISTLRKILKYTYNPTFPIQKDPAFYYTIVRQVSLLGDTLGNVNPEDKGKHYERNLLYELCRLLGTMGALDPSEFSRISKRLEVTKGEKQLQIENSLVARYEQKRVAADARRGSYKTQKAGVLSSNSVDYFLNMARRLTTAAVPDEGEEDLNESANLIAVGTSNQEQIASKRLLEVEQRLGYDLDVSLNNVLYKFNKLTFEKKHNVILDYVREKRKFGKVDAGDDDDFADGENTQEERSARNFFENSSSMFHRRHGKNAYITREVILSILSEITYHNTEKSKDASALLITVFDADSENSLLNVEHIVDAFVAKISDGLQGTAPANYATIVDIMSNLAVIVEKSSSVIGRYARNLVDFIIEPLWSVAIWGRSGTDKYRSRRRNRANYEFMYPTMLLVRSLLLAVKYIDFEIMENFMEKFLICLDHSASLSDSEIYSKVLLEVIKCLHSVNSDTTHRHIDRIIPALVRVFASRRTPTRIRDRIISYLDFVQNWLGVSLEQHTLEIRHMFSLGLKTSKSSRSLVANYLKSGCFSEESEQKWVFIDRSAELRRVSSATHSRKREKDIFTHLSFPEDGNWKKWRRRLLEFLFDCSPSPSIRACSQMSTEFKVKLFVPAVYSFIDSSNKTRISTIFGLILTSKDVPIYIQKMIIDVYDFMSLIGCELDIPLSSVSAACKRAGALAKAVLYEEQDYVREPTREKCGSLIVLHKMLGNTDTALGIIKLSKQHSIDDTEQWLEELGSWDEALAHYNAKYEKLRRDGLSTVDVEVKMIRVYAELREWEDVYRMTVKVWDRISITQKRRIAPISTRAAWNLGKLSAMKRYARYLDKATTTGLFLDTITTIKLGDWDSAIKKLERAILKNSRDLSLLLNEGYLTAYPSLVTSHQLEEMEEVINSLHNPEVVSRDLVGEMWNRRLSYVRKVPWVWEDILSVHSLLFGINSNPENVLRLVKLLKDKPNTAGRLLRDLYDSFGDKNARVVYEYAKYLWHRGNIREAEEKIKRFINSTHDVGEQMVSKFHLLYGRLFGTKSLDKYREQVSLSLQHYSKYFSVWKEWGMVNLRLSVACSDGNRERYIKDAMDGFANSIDFVPVRKSVQSVLRLFNIYLTHGGDYEGVQAKMQEIINRKRLLRSWLLITPQLIAMIDTENKTIRQTIQEIIESVALQYPQGMVFPLTVSKRSLTRRRKIEQRARSMRCKYCDGEGCHYCMIRVRSAPGVMLDKIRIQHSQLLDEAYRVSEELIRISVSWREKWKDGLDNLLHLLDDEKFDLANIPLDALYGIQSANPTEVDERSFKSKYGAKIDMASKYYMEFLDTGDSRYLESARKYFANIRDELDREISRTRVIKLGEVSKTLKSMRNLRLCVPGTFDVENPDTSNFVTIHRFGTEIHIIKSQQRPRKIVIYGSDGSENAFLLKGKEDLRQDERIMQLFGLLNNVLLEEKANCGLIRTYEVLPLSLSAGLIGWVDGSNTLHELILENRRIKGEGGETELEVLGKFSGGSSRDFDKLCRIQRVEAVRVAREGRTLNDIREVMERHTESSERYLNNRYRYTRSNALMSGVGYVIGLGDRHPSNIMMDRTTGNIVHVDFSDCFDVARHRNFLPERVPFRLTPIILNAMEITGYEGVFRNTLERTLQTLGKNKETITVLLETYVHEPLFNWNFTSIDRLWLLDEGVSVSNRGEVLYPPENYRSEHSDGGGYYMDYESTDGCNYIYCGSETPTGSSLHSCSEGDSCKSAGMHDVPPAKNRLEQEEKGRKMIQTILLKLEGKEAEDSAGYTHEEQVDRLIKESIDEYNVSSHYSGWYPFW